MIYKYLKVGATLQPQTSATGYAVLIEIAQEKHPEGKTLYTLLTDFGNFLTLNQAELEELYNNECYFTDVSEYVREGVDGEVFQDPHDFNIAARFMTQLHKLMDAEKVLKDKGLL